MTRFVPPGPPVRDGVVLLRAFRADDAPAVAAMCDDAEAARWLELPSPYDLEDARAWLAGRHERTAAGIELPLALVVGADVVGTVSLLRLVRRFRLAEVGYVAAAGVRGKGYVVRGVRVLSRYAFDELGIARLEIRVHPDNEASARVAERAGFRREARLRDALELHGRRHDAVVWGLLPRDLGPHR